MQCRQEFFFLITACIARPIGISPKGNWDYFPREIQLRQSRATQATVHAGCMSVSIIHRTLTCVHAGCLSVSIIHRTLTWTTGSLTCAQMLMYVVAHGDDLSGHRKRVLVDSGSLHQGTEPVSAACRSDALPAELSYTPALHRGFHCTVK